MSDALLRIAEALERLAPAPLATPDLSGEAFVWHTAPDRLEPVARVARVDIGLLIGVDRSRDTLLANTRHFAAGLPANNALLWGARGMGKSSLVKAVHAQVRAEGFDLKIVELNREDLPSVGRLLGHLRGSEARFILFCDDLSFAQDDQHYKSLKAVLDGGIEGRPEINPGEAVEEKVSLSDRFGLWLGFHPCTQDDYLAMIRGYMAAYGVVLPEDRLWAEAIEWQATRGARSGRVAWQFFCDLAARHGVKVGAA